VAVPSLPGMWPPMFGMPGYGYGETAPPPRSRRRDRDDSSESRDRHAAKRKRSDAGNGPPGDDRRDKDDRREKKDKKSKKDKRGEKDRRNDDVHARVDDRERDRARRPQELLADPRRSSRGHDRDRDPLEIGGGGGGRLAGDTPSSDRRSARTTSRDLPPSAAAAAPSANAAEAPSKSAEPESGSKNKRWREEVVSEDERDLSEDEEAVEKKLEEAKRRREALKAKHAANAASKQGEDGSSAAAAGGAGAAGGGGGEKAAADGTAGGATGSTAKPGDVAAASGGSREGDAEVKDAGIEAEASEVASKNGAAEAKAEPRGPSPSAGDMFDASEGAAEQLKKGERYRSTAIGFTGASGEDWDDEEGYYIPKIGEVMGDRYLVVETACGRGVFSNVVKAKDQQAAGEEDLVAIKVMRANDMMTKAAEKEVAILETLNGADRKNKRHIIRLLSTFAYRKHFCLVFECMWDDLRAAVRKYTKNKGMALQAVRAYTQQLLVGLGHMRDHGVIHADIKPDNILISKGHQTVKFCDLGTAVELKDVIPSPYLASRFYRPPEVILGCEYSSAVDMWALGCTLYEIFTGKTLLQSKTNNDHLKKIMELRGRVPGKVIKKGHVWKNHFTDELDFKHQVEDPGSGQQVIKTITDFSTKTSIKDLILDRVGEEKRKSQDREDTLYVKRATQFADLLEQMLAMDPEKRIRPEEALAHPFLQDGVGKAAQEAAAKQAAAAREAAKR